MAKNILKTILETKPDLAMTPPGSTTHFTNAGITVHTHEENPFNEKLNQFALRESIKESKQPHMKNANKEAERIIQEMREMYEKHEREQHD